MNWPLFLNSLLVSGGTTLLAGATGLAVALWFATAGTRGRWLLILVVAALALPPFLVTNTWLDLLGANGKLTRWLPWNIYSIPGAILLLASLMWPMTTLLVLGAWRRLEPAQLEGDPALRGGGLLRWLLWPAARVAAGQAAVITFVLALNNFSVPVILQVPVFPEELWLAFTTRLNDAGAWAAAWPMAGVSLAVAVLLWRREIEWPRLTDGVTAEALRRQLGGGWRWTAGIVMLLALAFSLGVPAVQLIASSRTWAELPNLFRAAPGVVWNSFAHAAATATVCVALALVTWRLRPGPMLWLPFLVPGVLVGRAMIFLFNETAVYGTSTLVVAAFSLRYLAVGWSVVSMALRSVDHDLTDAARLAGARGWTLLRHAQWPQIAPRVAAAWYVTYLLCLWDVETLVLIQPPGGETLALRIFNLLHYGHNAQVNALCVTLVGLAVTPLAAWSVWHRLARRRNGK